MIPLPETRVVLQRQGDDDKTEYINANYVRVSQRTVKQNKQQQKQLKSAPAAAFTHDCLCVGGKPLYLSMCVCLSYYTTVQTQSCLFV